MKNKLKYWRLVNFTLLDIYLIKQLVPHFIFGIAVCSVLAELIGISFEQVRFIIEQGLPLVTSIYIHFLKLPAYVAVALPYAVLLASIFTYSQISRNSELIALQSCGVSLYRLAIPPLLMGLTASIIMFGFNEFIVPPANYNTAITLEKSMGIDRNTLDKYHKENIFYKEYSGQLNNGKRDKHLKTLFFAGNFNRKNMTDITIVNYRNNKLSEIIVSQSIQWNEQKQTWQLYQGSKNLVKSDGSYGQRIKFEKLDLHNLSRNLWDYIQLNRDFKEMNLWKLYRRLKIIINTEKSKEIRDLKINIQQRYTYPFSCIIFAIFGFAISVNPQARNATKSSRFSITIITIFIYYVLNFLSISLCQTEVMPISFSVWLPNTTGAAIACFILTVKN